MGYGGAEAAGVQPVDGLVDRGLRPAGDGHHLRPVEEWHRRQGPEGLGFTSFSSHCSASSSSVVFGFFEALSSRFSSVSRAVLLQVGCAVLEVPDLLLVGCPGVLQVLGRQGVCGGSAADLRGDGGVSLLRLSDHHREGGHPLDADGGADVAVVHRQRRDVVLGHPLLAQLPDQLPCVVPGHLEDGQASNVGEEGVPHGAGEVVELGEALGGQYKADAPNLPSSESIDS